MRILYLNHYAGSPLHGMEYRPYYLSREWVRAGHEVQVIAASYSHVRARQPETGGAPINQSIDGIGYCWLPTPTYRGNGVGRVRNIFSFLMQVWQLTPRLVREFRPEVVIASSTYPMDIYIARRIAQMARATLVFEVHDLWPLSPIELSGMSPWHPWALLCQKAEDDAYRDANVVVSMLPKVGGHMLSRGLDLRKLHIVPNGISPDEWQGHAAPLDGGIAAHLIAQRQAGRCIVGYAGSHGLPNALDTLLDAARLMKDEPIAFVLVGDGLEKARLAQRLQAEGLTNVAMFPPVPKAQIPSLLAEFDIAYIGWQRVPIYRFGIAPNKLMDYMMAGCAVLHSVQAGNDPVAEAGCGITVAPESPQAIAHGLRELAAMSPAQRRAMGERGQDFVRAKHTYPVLARRFIDAVLGRGDDTPIPAAEAAHRTADVAVASQPASAANDDVQAALASARHDDEALVEAFSDTQPNDEALADAQQAAPAAAAAGEPAALRGQRDVAAPAHAAPAVPQGQTPHAAKAAAQLEANAGAANAAHSAPHSTPHDSTHRDSPHAADHLQQAHRHGVQLAQRLEPSFGDAPASAPAEPEAIAQRYARRGAADRYQITQPDVWQTWQERQRAMLKLFRHLKMTDLSQPRLLEVGCGSGGNLLDFLRMGFLPEHLSGVELLPERCAEARRRLPESLLLRVGDAAQLPAEPSSQDIVFVSTVFSSILDRDFQRRLADAMWQWVKPGGGVLWYDFILNNPNNPDVRGVPVRRLAELFPEGKLRTRHVTLAPPLARAATRVHPSLYTLFNTLPTLRTHVLAWVAKT